MKEQKCEGQSDTSLSPLGKTHAKKIGQYFKDKHIRKIISSNLHRTNQCSKIITTFLPFKIQRDPRLTDMNLGVWQGKFPEEIENRYPEIWEQWKKDPSSVQIPEGEHWNSVESRLKSFLSELRDDELFDKNMVIVTHDIIIRVLLMLIQGKNPENIWEYQLDRAGISEVQVVPEKQILQLNYTDHLYVPSFN